MTSIEELYHFFHKDIYAFVLSMCNQPNVAEEITQETFLKAIKGIERFKGDCDIRVWLCQIAKNTFYTYSKKTKREILTSLNDEITEIVSDVNIVENIENQETVMEIHKALHTLEDPYKEVFYLRVFGNLSFSKIACIYGKTESWARVTYHRAKNMIRERMEDLL